MTGQQVCVCVCGREALMLRGAPGAWIAQVPIKTPTLARDISSGRGTDIPARVRVTS